jgi:hypothetical protein
MSLRLPRATEALMSPIERPLRNPPHSPGCPTANAQWWRIPTPTLSPLSHLGSGAGHRCFTRGLQHVLPDHTAAGSPPTMTPPRLYNPHQTHWTAPQSIMSLQSVPTLTRCPPGVGGQRSQDMPVQSHTCVRKSRLWRRGGYCPPSPWTLLHVGIIPPWIVTVVPVGRWRGLGSGRC